MRRGPVLVGSFLGSTLVAACVALAGTRVTASTPQETPARAVCVFSNPSYAGRCTQTTDVPKGGTPQEACEGILSCLNDTRCLKTYCGATEIRGGWRLESAKAEPPAS